MMRLNFFLSFCVLTFFFIQCTPQIENNISLQGKWQVKLDSLNVGVNENWAAKPFIGTNIHLPGTLDDANIGKPNTLKPAINNYVLSNLTRKHQFIGMAWYQKEIEIPKNWDGKIIELSLERVIWESKVFIDGKFVGSANSLVGTHDFNLTRFLKPGKHLLTILIDNSNKFPLINVAGSKYPDKVNQDMAHAYTNHTQIKWNGILGDIVLKASGFNHLKNLQVYPNLQENKIKVSYNQKQPATNDITCEITTESGEIVFKGKIEKPLVKGDLLSFEINSPSNLEFWDEFNPSLYNLKVVSGNEVVAIRFGYKEIRNNSGQLTLNGHRIFLRGNLECVIFPLTGYPPSEKSNWAKLIKQAKAYGLNHLRFHSWCPPKAAFDAADEAGFYFQVELPQWSLNVGQDENTNQYLIAEGNKIINDYGNHPSFILMSMGNELEGDSNFLNKMVFNLKQKDNRHLYTTTTYSFQSNMGSSPQTEDEFFVTQRTDKGWVRGQGIFNSTPPHFNADYSASIDHINMPLISHEIGQYSVYPDMSEIPKYTGVLEPLNFKAIKNDLEKQHLIDLAEDFTLASGKLAAILYKEEIERALKTPGLDGFQLLQLQDFPGQGTALVGVLNAFWESKGVISGKEFRQFNSEVVPLVRFDKAVYEVDEHFKATIEVANFFKSLKSQTINWSITNEQGKIINKGSLENVDLHIGNNQNLGEIDYLVKTDISQQLILTVILQGTKYENNWPIWIYPKSVETTSKNVLITASFKEAIKALEKGRNVFLNPNLKFIKGIEGRFVPVFWSPVHFPDQPGTMGLLIDNKHKALSNFPTKSHSDWQWWDLCINSKSVITDAITVTPIVRVIDNFVTNHHLSNVFEAKVGKGKLIFTSIDLSSDLVKRPVARQLKNSLLRYMESEEFNPSSVLEVNDLKTLKLN